MPRSRYQPRRQQDFEALRDECLQNGVLFEDPDFPAYDSSLYFTRHHPNLSRYQFQWMRPQDICDNPLFISEGVSRFDVVQGVVGDCWMLAATAALTTLPGLFKRVVPSGQGFQDNYAGIFHFKFWRYGEWIDVVVDDRIPMVMDPVQGRPAFFSLHSDQQNEFWSALLEKAYAKVHGSYEALEGGHTSDALVDFTGGVTETYMLDPNNVPPKFYQILKKAHDRGSLMGVSGIKGGTAGLEAVQSNGLVQQHAYSVTGFATVNEEQIVRVRNPWGKIEWKGPWSDESPQWEGVTEERKEELGVVKRDDGEFWMSFQDFLDIWKTLEICHLEPSVGEVEPELVGCKKWNSTERHGKWQRGMTAGGCANYRTSTFCSNPQYIVQVEDPDDEDDDDTCTVVFSLIQKDRRKQKHLGKANLAVGFYIYETAPNQKKLKKRDVCTRRPAATSGSYINLREVTKRVKLPPGNYIVMPSTFKPNEEADFLLRIYTEKPSTTEDQDDFFVDRILEEKHHTDAEPEQVIRREQTVEVKKPEEAEGEEGKEKEGEEEKPTPTLVGEKEDRVRKAFEVIASMGGDEEVEPAVDTYELKSVIDVYFKDPSFTLDVCRDMVMMYDADGSGKIEYSEFKELWNDICGWMATFNKSDANKNGKLESYELREALRDVCGVTIDAQLTAKIIRRYADQDNTISAASFWRIAIRLKAFFDSPALAGMKGRPVHAVSNKTTLKSVALLKEEVHILLGMFL
ncbi:calpain-2 catalytic subunit-like isoform X1 [Branchiostoma floridae]|uniref:Calpain-2 catalytic subunit-like isoform X1 n=1 Tax=Branchiostoma floridae TaxID=7739 RepID=A0A9J7L323_BRAFL|nr:calpain-2 catalytic subunit-like isoform X1 [Branchiostoma floridae]